MTSSKAPLSAAELSKRNVQDLARVMATEAGGAPGETGQIAVGWCLRNRMIRNHTDDVREVWRPAFQHRAPATIMTLKDAASILAGSIPDPTHGATHFYTPAIMPKKGDKTDGVDVGGGLELVPGVTRNGKPIKNYAPAFALTFTPRPVPTIPERTFKFYQQPGSGHVH